MSKVKRLIDYFPKEKIIPRNVPKNTQPITITGEQCSELISVFLEEGHTNHSIKGATVWVILTYCLEMGLIHTFYQTETGFKIVRIFPEE